MTAARTRHWWPASAAALALLAPRAAFAHPGAVAGPDSIWRQWGASPAELLLLLGPALWYWAGLRRLRGGARRGRAVSGARAASFSAGMLVLALALASPLDAMAEALFSAHMVQHLLLVAVAAPLCVAGAPLVPMLWAVPRGGRRALGAWWRGRANVRRVVHLATEPGVVFVAHMLALWFWHFPVPYQAALASPSLHAAEHASFFGTALLFWWAVLAPAGRRRVGEGGAILLVGGTLMQSGVLGAVLMFARAPWYPAHAGGARAWGMTPLADQQLAGLLMWIPASVVYMGAAAWLFIGWMRRGEGGDGASRRIDCRTRVLEQPTYRDLPHELHECADASPRIPSLAPHAAAGLGRVAAIDVERSRAR